MIKSSLRFGGEIAQLEPVASKVCTDSPVAPLSATTRDLIEVALDHLFDQFVERHPVLPAQFTARLARIAEQEIDFGGPEVVGIDLDQCVAGLFVDADFVLAVAAPGDLPADHREGAFDQFAHGVRFAGGQHIVARLRLLEHHPHAIDIVALVAPVAARIQVPYVALFLLPVIHRGNAPLHLTRAEWLAAALALVLEWNAARGVY